MAFKSCRKCGYKFVPLDYGHCPKCNASVRASREARLMLRGGLIALAGAALLYAALFILPRISVTMQ